MLTNIDKITIHIERSLQNKMSQFDNELERLNAGTTENSLDKLIDVDLTYNRSEIANFDVPAFPRPVYQFFKKVWIDSFNSFYPEKKPPTSNQIKKLWKSWYSPFFDEAEWWEDWEENRKEKISLSVSKAYSQRTQYTDIEAQKEFLLDFDAKSFDSYNLEPRYTAFIEFISKFIFKGELIEFNDLTPFQLESIKIEDKDDLPEESGIYFIIDQSNLYYIGMSLNLQKRWYNHHKQKELDSLPNLSISYLDCLPKHYLKNIESALIEHFQPKLNIVGNPLYKANN